MPHSENLIWLCFRCIDPLSPQFYFRECTALPLQQASTAITIINTQYEPFKESPDISAHNIYHSLPPHLAKAIQIIVPKPQNVC